jgi:hypothetical protein
MSALYEAELKYEMDRPMVADGVHEFLHKATVKLKGKMKALKNATYDDWYFFSHDGQSHIRCRVRGPHKYELTSKTMLAATEFVRIEPEFDATVDLHTITAFMRNIGFTHRLTVNKKNVILGDATWETEEGRELIPLMVSFYTAHATYPDAHGVKAQKHFLEFEVDKNWLSLPETPEKFKSATALDQIMKGIADTIDLTHAQCPTTQLLFAHFTQYHTKQF